MLNAAVIGLGWWGKQIVTCLAGSDRITVRRGVDVNLDGVRDFAAVQGFDLGDSYEDVLADDDIDAVILVTPHALHESQVLAAAAAGHDGTYGVGPDDRSGWGALGDLSRGPCGLAPVRNRSRRNRVFHRLCQPRALYAHGAQA